MSISPGWYADPAEPTTQRYWDGGGWVGRALPVDATPPEGPLPEEPAPAQAPVSPAPVSPAPVSPAPVSPAQGAPPGGFPTGGGPAAPGAPAEGYPPPGAGYPPPGAGYPPPGAGPHPQPGWPQQPYPPYPYGPPPQPRPHGLALAGFGPRFLARLIDFGIVFLLNAVVNSWFVWKFIEEIAPVWREIWRRSLVGDSSTEGLPQAGEQAGGLQVAILLIATALWFAYEVPGVANRGQTLGKRILRIKVVTLGENPAVGFGRSFRRWNTLGLPTLLWYCCGLGLVLQLIDAVSPLFDRTLRQALHDKRAQTVVVQLPAEPTKPDTPGDAA